MQASAELACDALDFIDGVKDLENSREPDAKKKAKLTDLAVALKVGAKNKHDYEALARAGIELGKSITSLSNVEIDTENLTDRGRDALELNELLKKLENGEQIDFNRLNELSLRAAASDKNTHAPEVTTFNAALDQAADEISSALAEHAKKGVSSLEFAGEHDLEAAFRQLSAAARVGNRTQMVIATKTIHALVRAFCAEEDKLASTSNNRVAKDRMTRSTTAMGNLSTQLKILSTVRVVSIATDTDEQLINVVRNLSRNFKEALASDEIIKLSKK